MVGDNSYAVSGVAFWKCGKISAKVKRRLMSLLLAPLSK
jgi:hypothetical protein